MPHITSYTYSFQSISLPPPSHPVTHILTQNNVHPLSPPHPYPHAETMSTSSYPLTHFLTQNNVAAAPSTLYMLQPCPVPSSVCSKIAMKMSEAKYNRYGLR